MPRIYVAGPYSNGNVLGVLNNMRIGIRKCTELLVRGYAPFCPWLDYHYTLMLRGDETITGQMYYDYSLAWLEAAEAVLLLPGWETSQGTLKEIERAEALNIPVFKPEEEEAFFDYFEVLHDGFDIAKEMEEAIG